MAAHPRRLLELPGLPMWLEAGFLSSSEVRLNGVKPCNELSVMLLSWVCSYSSC